MSHITPDPRVAALLRVEVGRHIGQRWVNHFRFAWEPERELLCLYQLSLDGKWSVKHELKDEDGYARQCNEWDVERLVTSRYGWCEKVDTWRKQFEERKAKRVDDRLATRKEMATAAAKTMVRVWREGFKEYAMPEPARPERVSEADGLRVTDRRRSFDEAVA